LAVFSAFATPSISLLVNTGGGGGGSGGGTTSVGTGGGGGSGGLGGFFFGSVVTIVSVFFLGATAEAVSGSFLFGFLPFLAAISASKTFSSCLCLLACVPAVLRLGRPKDIYSEKILFI